MTARTRGADPFVLRTARPMGGACARTRRGGDAGRPPGACRTAGDTVLVGSSVPPPTADRLRSDRLRGLPDTSGRAPLLPRHRLRRRPVFATRFPEADDVLVDWLHSYLESTQADRRTALCMLTHDAKFDAPLLTGASKLPVAYVGAIGSRATTHADRRRRLLEAGSAEGELSRLRAPIGLDLGAHTPEETAFSPPRPSLTGGAAQVCR